MSWKHIEDTHPQARHKYKCLLCQLFIYKDEKHIKRFGINEDAKASFRMHIACEKVTWNWDPYEWEYLDPYEFRDNIGPCKYSDI